MDRRHEDLLFDLGQHLVGDQRRRAVGAHAAGVRAVVAVAGRLVILAGGQGEHRAGRR